MSAAAPLPLTARFKKSSRELEALSSALVQTRLVGLFADRAQYGRALGLFWLVHKQLDLVLKENISRGQPDILKLEGVLAKIYRTPAFEQDLAFYLGESWREQILPTPEVLRYLDHLAALSSQRPELLLAHSYTQHLALLAAGPVLRRLARQGMQLPPGQGTAIFEFQDAGGDLRQSYKQAVDAAAGSWSEETMGELVEEHRKAMRFNDAIVSSFNLGLLAPLTATLRLVPGYAWAGAAASVTGVVVAVALRRRGYSLPALL